MTTNTDAPNYGGENLIFLISQPRAGSTLLQRLLAAHTQVHSVSEPWLMLHPVYALRPDGFSAEFNAELSRIALRDFLDQAVDGEEAYYEAIRAMAKVLYDRALGPTGKAIFLDKTPRYFMIIPELYRLFPKARFIFLWRNPLAVLHSIHTTWVKGEWENFPRRYVDLLVGPHLIRDGIESLGDHAIVVHYEDLAVKPEETLQSLCQQLALPFEPAMLHYDEHPIPTGELGDPSGVYDHVTVTDAMLEKWRRLGDSRQTRHFALSYLDELSPSLVEAMGYDFDQLRDSIAQTRPRPQLIRIPWTSINRPLKERSAKWFFIKTLSILQREGLLGGTVLFVKKAWRAWRCRRRC